jgi:hypothetical protein
MNHASGTVAPLDPELLQVGDAIGQRAQRRCLVQGSVRCLLYPGEVTAVCQRAGLPLLQPEQVHVYRFRVDAELLSVRRRPGTPGLSPAGAASA